MRAIDCLLADAIDYAGLYPPVALDMHTAVRNFLEYSHSAHRRTLGRFIVDLDRFPYLWDAAGDYVRGLRLSVIASPQADWDDLSRLADKGYAIEAIEIKGAETAEIGQIAGRIPDGITVYFEVPIAVPPAALDSLLDATSVAGARVKIRTGGTTHDAFPSAYALARMLAELAARRLMFKATAGLHHPIRGRHALTYADASPTAVMHGFVNLACAAALLHFGGNADEARRVLEEEWRGEWKVTPEAIVWEEYGWSGDELREVRRQFFAGFGSCSFEEPVHELEALRWL